MWPRIVTLALLLLQGISLEDRCKLSFPLPGRELRVSEQWSETPLQADWERTIVRGLYAVSSGLSGDLALPEDELAELNLNASKHSVCLPSTFGEMNALRLFTDHRFALGPDDVFVDLGSGVGKSVIAALLLFNVSEAVGVELSASRFARSCSALRDVSDAVRSLMLCGKRCQERVRRPGSIEMIRSNMLDFDLRWATVVTVFATCYPPQVQAALLGKLLRELRPGSRVYAPGHKWGEPLPQYGKALVALTDAAGPLASMFRVEVSSGQPHVGEL